MKRSVFPADRGIWAEENDSKNLNLRLSCKVSAEKKRVSQAVSQEKGNLLEGKEKVTGP